ncbi:MAG: hypothetical protein SFU56_19845 [Capsulimonadales bacterium]|nr:hypothetical protein [Capsulimonadales bacterium]
MHPSIAMILIAAAFGGVTYITERTERRAHSCPVHNRAAGKAARLLGVLCGFVAAGLLFAAYLFRDL